ncbi:cysteine-rich CWC family protein [Emticicia fluvialis]|uniref:cysteine-rich CWC family protein n=1 Tax=Emticicia fluvialis TaxID=2974474 RepID=UPI0036F2E0DA
MSHLSTTYPSQVCPRCQQPFTCLASEINNCACKSILLSDALIAEIGIMYSSCLCIKCLETLKKEQKPASWVNNN